LGYTRDWCSEGDSNTHHRRSERRVSADWTTGAVLAGGFDPPGSVLTQDGAPPNERPRAKWCSVQEIEPAACRLQGGCSSGREHGAGSVNRTPGCPLREGRSAD